MEEEKEKKKKKRIRHPKKDKNKKHFVLEVHDSNLSGATGFGK